MRIHHVWNHRYLPGRELQIVHDGILKTVADKNEACAVAKGIFQCFIKTPVI